MNLRRSWPEELVESRRCLMLAVWEYQYMTTRRSKKAGKFPMQITQNSRATSNGYEFSASNQRHIDELERKLKTQRNKAKSVHNRADGFRWVQRADFRHVIQNIPTMNLWAQGTREILADERVSECFSTAFNPAKYRLSSKK